MNIKEYIESGVLEAYVLGALSADERARVQADIAQYPQLADEVAAIEQAMYQHDAAQLKEPPAHIKEQVWAAIQSHSRAGTNGGAINIPLRPAARPVFRNAAVWAALVGSLIVNAILYQRVQQGRQETAVMSQQLTDLTIRQQQMAATVSKYDEANKMLADTAIHPVVMRSVVKDHPMAATVYWSKQKGAAYVALNALPKPPAGKQYQMWVIQDGKPVSMGVLPGDMAGTGAMHKLDMSVSSAAAFAISLEKVGGNPTPTEVYVLGSI